MNQLIPVSEPMAQSELNVYSASMPTPPQVLNSPQSNVSAELESSQHSTQLNDIFINITKTSPQPQNPTFTPVMTSSPHMSSFDNQAFIQSSTQSSQSRPRYYSFSSYETYIRSENRSYGRFSIDSSALLTTGQQFYCGQQQTQTESLPGFTQAIGTPITQSNYSQIGSNEGMAQINYANTSAINIPQTTQTYNHLNQSYSMPAIRSVNWDPNYCCYPLTDQFGHNLKSASSEPSFSFETEVTYSGRGGRGYGGRKRGKSNSQKLKDLLEEMAALEAQKSHLQRTVTGMEAKKAQCRALLQRLGFPVPNDPK
jgi:hypothetical protein